MDGGSVKRDPSYVSSGPYEREAGSWKLEAGSDSRDLGLTMVLRFAFSNRRGWRIGET